MGGRAADVPGSNASDLNMRSFLQCPRMSPPSVTNDAALRERLLGMTTATATNMLNLRGCQHQCMGVVRAIQEGGRACGRALTVRFGPARPDMTLPQDERHHVPLWLAIESIVPGDFLVLDCGG